MSEFRKLLGQKINKLFLVVLPPWGEEKLSDIDISLGFIFKDEPNSLCVISIDKDELWSPNILNESIPITKYNWEDFYIRMRMWMEAKDNTKLIFDIEYYDVTDWKIFEKIINSEIMYIELLYIENIPLPFGIKLLFENDYIISTPNSDGNTIQSKEFNKNDYIENFKQLGNIIYLKI